MTRTRVAILALLVAAALTAFGGKTVAAKNETLDQLIARADSARPEDRPALYLEIARQKAEAADKYYNGGNAEAAKAVLQDVVAFSRKATNTSIQTGKKLKNVEIGLRKMTEKLRDVKRRVAFEDQPPIQQTVDELEQMRTELLSAMFGKKKSQ
jgi:hypothetical protein